MTDSKTALHESPEALPPETVDRHRAIVSIMEELEAIDWYDQRVAAAADGELRAILAHNRDEEKEHAAMVIEWLRRNDPTFHKHLADYLFTEGPITGREPGAGDAAPPEASHDQSLGIAGLKEAMDDG